MAIAWTRLIVVDKIKRSIHERVGRLNWYSEQEIVRAWW